MKTKTKIATIGLISATALISCKTTPSISSASMGQDAQMINHSRGAAGAVMTKDQADNYHRQRDQAHGEIELSDAGHRSKVNRIHDGLDLLSRVARF